MNGDSSGKESWVSFQAIASKTWGDDADAGVSVHGIMGTVLEVSRKVPTDECNTLEKCFYCPQFGGHCLW